MLLLSLKIYISVLKRKTSLGLMLKHETSTARVEINSTRALPVIARAWLRHCFQHKRGQPDSGRTSPITELILTTCITNAIHSKGDRNEDQRPLTRDHEGYTELNQNAYMYIGYVCIFYTYIAHTQLMYV